jgi:hypothetical protein
MAYGKFMVARMDVEELLTKTAMPEAPPDTRLLTYSGRRRFNNHSTLVVDLQRGSAFAWPLEGGELGMNDYIAQHLEQLPSLVCPMYLPFVRWLHDRRQWGMGRGSLRDIPRYLDLRLG